MELIRKSDALHAVLHSQGDAAVAAVQAIRPINPHGELREMLIDEMIDKGEWIKCSERLPEKSKNVLVANRRGKQYDIDKAWWNGLYFDRCGKKPYWNVTHWMPLPDAPEVEG